MNPTPTSHRFRTYDLCLEALRLIRAPLAAIRVAAPGLADQLQRAATSAALNLAEGAKRRGRDQAHYYRVAAGSAAEARACLDIAAALGHADPAELAPAWAALDSVVAMIWRLTHR
ncbi:MAG: four helix bundle protein [Deltaproteobacteria bacterium]|nr:four helix bundle protein [Deltaproteobacteria bacterium]